MVSGKTDHALERLVFFSDAVFAIAITLLVIEIHPPHLERGEGAADHFAALARLIPNFIGFAVSFGVIGFFWAGHHRAFTMAGRYHGGILVWNLALLGAIAFVPFVTAFMSVNYNMLVPALFYWGWIVLTALLNLKVNSIATGPLMLGEDASGEAARAVPRRSRAVLLGAVTASLVAALAPLAAPVGMATIPLWIRLQGRMARPAAA
ncbi:MAG: potassium channel family protein [Sphingomonadales bacterium]|nr:potassium channel family protein [Sphingomonadales bacterium]